MRNSPKENAVLNKSYEFALSVIRLSGKLQKSQEFVLSRQLVRSGTSVGANVEEAQAAQSRKDFHAKMCQAEKEAREVHYWLRLIRDSFKGFQLEASNLLGSADELKRLLASITKATKNG